MYEKWFSKNKFGKKEVVMQFYVDEEFLERVNLNRQRPFLTQRAFYIGFFVRIIIFGMFTYNTNTVRWILSCSLSVGNKNTIADVYIKQYCHDVMSSTTKTVKNEGTENNCFI